MNNNMINQIMSMMGRAGNNPQAFAQQLMRSNPQFANAIQGQDVQKMAMQMLNKNGIDINSLLPNLKR